MKRILLVLAIVVLVAIGGVVYYVLHNLDAIVKQAIEREGSAVTGTPVRVGSVDISLTEGRGTVRGLRIGNPEGFETADALSLGEITLDLVPKSVTQNPVVLDAIVIARPVATLELDPKGRVNLRVLQQHVQAYSAGRGGGAPAPAPAPPAEARRLTVRRFQFRDGTLDLRTQAAGGENASVKLPSLSLTDLGGSRGATGAQIGKQVLAAYLEHVLRIVARQQLDRQIEQHLEGQEGEAVKKLLDRVLE